MLAKSIFITLVLVGVEGFSRRSRTQCFGKGDPSTEDITAESSDDSDSWEPRMEFDSSTELNEVLKDRSDEATRPRKCGDKSTGGVTGFSWRDRSYRSKSNGRLLETNCRRAPQHRKELLISGRVFRELCKYFGPRVRDEIVSGLDDEVVLRRCSVAGEKPGGYDHDRAYTMALEIQKPLLTSCFKIALHYYSNDTAEFYSARPRLRYPACFPRLAINHEPDFQILWINSFPQLYKYFLEVMKGIPMMSRAEAIVELYLDQGLMDNWMTLEEFAWAKAMVAAWKNSQMQDTSERLKKIVQNSPRLLDICKLANIASNEFENHRSDNCLNKILANLVIFEFILQEDGTTLEYEFIGGKPLTLNLLYAVKNVLVKKRSSSDLRRHQMKLRNRAKGEIYELRLANVRCVNDLRAIHEYGPFEEWIGSTHLYTCLKIFSMKITKLMKTGLSLHGPEILECNRARAWRRAEANLMKSILDSFRQSKFLIPMIHLEIESGLLDIPLSEYPWAEQFIEKWRSPSIRGNKDRLSKIYHSINTPPVERTCPRYENNYKIMKDTCWHRYIAETILVESELMKSGLTLQLIFLGDPFLMNLIYFIDEALKDSSLFSDSEDEETEKEDYPSKSRNGNNAGRFWDEEIPELGVSPNSSLVESSSTTVKNKQLVSQIITPTNATINLTAKNSTKN